MIVISSCSLKNGTLYNFYEYAHIPTSITQIVDRVRFKNVKHIDRVM